VNTPDLFLLWFIVLSDVLKTSESVPVLLTLLLSFLCVYVGTVEYSCDTTVVYNKLHACLLQATSYILTT